MNLRAVIVNYQTPDHLEEAVGSFREHYPHLPLLIIDNGSRDDSVERIQRLAGGSIETRILPRNIFHGPAMDLALRESREEFVFLLDSDTVTRRAGFLEQMHEICTADPQVYAVGRLQMVNHRGFAAASGTQIVLTPYMFVRRAMYLTLPPFEHHGQPSLHNFKAAAARGYALRSFPIDDYVFHKGRGTASRFGYGLGLKGKMQFLLNKMGI